MLKIEIKLLLKLKFKILKNSKMPFITPICRFWQSSSHNNAKIVHCCFQCSTCHDASMSSSWCVQQLKSFLKSFLVCVYYYWTLLQQYISALCTPTFFTDLKIFMTNWLAPLYWKTGVKNFRSTSARNSCCSSSSPISVFRYSER